MYIILYTLCNYYIHIYFYLVIIIKKKKFKSFGIFIIFGK